ncbi:MAG: hypothetical protein HXK96_00480 [Candidatus Nanogingivalaceae bacterium]|nr:hypothetical protein [Candidatus Nanogingivalaceae bacterium]
MKKLFSKTIVGISLILGIFVGFVAFGSSDVKADTCSISFVLGDSLSEGNPVEASRIVVAGGTDSVNGRNQSVPYQKARSFIVQTGRSIRLLLLFLGNNGASFREGWRIAIPSTCLTELEMS